MRRVVGFTVAAAVLLLAVLAVMAGEGGAQVVGGDEDSLRELVSHMAYLSSYPGDEVTVTVAALPDNLPFDLPLPPGARVLGSIQRHDGSDVMLTANLSPAETVAFYTEALAAQDWRQLDTPGSGGFTAGTTEVVQFCDPQDERALILFAEGDDTTDLRLFVNDPADPYTCNPPGSLADPSTFLPRLETPDGVAVLPQGSASSSAVSDGHRSASNTAYLQSDLPLTDVAAAYNAQLTEQGWQQVSAEMGQNFAYSAWTFTDADGADWGGIFSLSASPGAHWIATITVLAALNPA